MPPKKPPFEYYDIGRPNILEDEEFAQELTHKIRRKQWEFLPESQLDENYAEWEGAAATYYVTASEHQAALETLASLFLVHTMSRPDAEDVFAAGVIPTHRYKAAHPTMYPDYERSPGCPTSYESAIGLDDYVSFSVQGGSSRTNKPGALEFFVGAIESLSKKDGFVLPFGPQTYQSIRPREYQPMVLQALALRTKDYLTLLPKLIAADSAGEPGAVLPQWFRRSFGDAPYIGAEIKFTGSTTFRDLEFGIIDKEIIISQNLLS